MVENKGDEPTIFPEDTPILEGLNDSIEPDGVEGRFKDGITILKDLHGFEFKLLSDVLFIFIHDPEILDKKKWKLGLRNYRLTVLSSCDLRPVNTLSPYILYMNRKLELSYGEYNNPSYLFADTLMKYIAFNQGELLDLLNNYPYVLPEKSDYYGPDCEGMHG